MLRLALVGMWIVLVTTGATFASVYLSRESKDGGTRVDKGEEQLTSDLTSIPVIRGGEVIGYVILQLTFVADRARLDEKKIDPVPYLKDAAFRVFFTTTEVNFWRLSPGDLDRLTAAVLAESNRRLGDGMVRQVLFQQLNFVKKEDIRTNWISNKNAGG